MTVAHINRIATAVPGFDIHIPFVRFARSLVDDDPRSAVLFETMVERAQIEQRWSCLSPGRGRGPEPDAPYDFYRRDGFPTTAERMRRYEREAPALAADAVHSLHLKDIKQITHLVIASCTGFSAPGLDFALIERLGLDPSVERTIVGFMGCYAAINALKVAHHIVRSEKRARVLVICLELSTLHLQETHQLRQLLSFLIFADGCAAALVTAEPRGLAIQDFRAVLAPDTGELITWKIGDVGFDMVLSGRVPAVLAEILGQGIGALYPGLTPADIEHWAIHPGGRSILDAAETALALEPVALAHSRDVLRRFGNMSSATILFVLQGFLETARDGALGCGMSFGPGLVAETMLFRALG
jgi:alpha-pyrone synthase